MLHSEYVVELSDTVKGYVTNLYNQLEDKVRVVPGGVDTEFFSPHSDRMEFRKELGINEDYVIFTLGRLDPRKGFPNLFEAAPHVIKGVEATGKQVRFFMSAGAKGELSPEENEEKTKIEAVIRKNELEKYVTWVGVIEDFTQVPKYYSMADVFVVPSETEPFGLVIVEAFACGTPVVATNHGGPPNILSEGVDGFTVDPHNYKGFADRILKLLLGEEGDRQKIREICREKAVVEYSWKGIAKKMYEVYEDAQKRKPEDKGSSYIMRYSHFDFPIEK